MFRHFYLIFLVFLFFTISAIAQRRGDADNKSSNNAGKLVKEAEKLWKDEKYAEAEKLYYQSLQYETLIFDLKKFLEKKMEMGDIKGANKFWTVIESKGQYLDVAYSEMALANLKMGSPSIGVKAAVKYFELFKGVKPGSYSTSLIFASIPTAYELQDRESIQRMNDAFKGMKKNMGDDPDRGQFYSEVYLKLLDGRYDEAIVRLEEIRDKGGLFMASKSVAKFILPGAYILKGDFVKAEEAIDDAVKNIFVKDKHFSKDHGSIALAKKDYKAAVTEFTTALSIHVFANPAKFKSYTKRAEAYEGLKEFDKAKKDYEAALVYYPEYEPALNGLARLEGRVITERLTDKIPPQIIITEPIASRGIILEAATNEVMIKGTATDPGGLKTVTINGEKVYSQEGGTFWGNVSLKEGTNKVLITATDFSGNTAEKTIEIERPANASASNAVPIKEGKNFALLIGCQNYDDSNIPSLEDPIPDAVKLKLILKNSYSFTEETIFTLFNPEIRDLKKQFLEMYEIIQPEDNLVIFYAGHGIWVDKEKKGYWLFTETKLNDQSTWLPNKDVLDMIARISARHTLLITDACFSGSLFKTRGLNSDMPTAIQKINEKISRVAITSGNDTEVPDKSVFMKYLVKALSENKEKYLTAQKMFINQIIEAVMTETKTEPRYGTLELAGHVGGDFIFIRK